MGMQMMITFILDWRSRYDKSGHWGVCHFALSSEYQLTAKSGFAFG